MVAIDGVVANAENDSRIRLPRGVYGKNMIALKISLDVSSDTNEWSYSCQMGNPKKNKITNKNGDGETKPLCWEKNKLTMTG